MIHIKREIIGIFFVIIMINLVSADVILNEVMPHNNNSRGYEWVELYNDGSDVQLIDWTIGDLSSNDSISLNISGNSYALIIDNSGDCSDFNIDEDSCFELTSIGSGLNDDSDTIYFYDDAESLVDSFSWDSDIQSEGKSWSFDGNDFIEALPTPGTENDNTNEEQNNEEENEDIILSMDWDEEDIINGEEFKITLEVENLLDQEYDVKVWIENEDGDIISDRYDDENNEWKSGRYYLYEFFKGPGDESEKIKLRIRDEYEDYEGDADIYFKLEGVDDEEKDNIEILLNDDNSNTESSTTHSVTDDIYEDYQRYIQEKAKEFAGNTEAEESDDGGIIRLGSPKEEESEDINTKNSVYESKTEIMKRYSIYSFALLCVILTVLLAWGKLQ